MSNLIDNLKSARLSGVPLIGIVTQDQPSTIDHVDTNLNACPKVTWDCLNGLEALNDDGKTALAGCGTDLRDSQRPVIALRACLKFPPKTMVFFRNSHAAMRDPAYVQGIQNLREKFKADKRTLVLLAPSFADMPKELQADVVILEEPLPTDEQLRSLISDLHDSAGKSLPAADKIPAIVSGVRGLPALFTVEQVLAMSFRKAGLDMGALWERKEAAINETQGLTITRGGMTYGDLAGMDTVMDFLRRYQQGPRPFRLVLFWDEIEKMMAGAGGGGEQTDSSGVSSDFLNVCLKVMERLRWAGAIFFGVPGSGKTALAEATSGEFDVPMISMDFGAMKGRYVGDSEAAVRQAFRVVEGIGETDVLVLASCNKMRALPSEFRRRFWLQAWYFDIPTPEEQIPIKTIYERKFDLAKSGPWPDTTDWTGSEIRNCAELSVRLKCSLVQAGKYVVPIAKSDPEMLEQLRAVAEGRFLSVSHEGTWSSVRPEMAQGKTKRRLEN